MSATASKGSRRSRLLAAATPLAERHALAELTPAVVAEAAGLTLADFAAEFETVGDYLAEVHHQYLEGILTRIVAEAGGMPPSLERILLASTIQLDICLEQHALRNLIAEARRGVPRVAEDLHKRNRGTALMISIELKSIGCRQPMITARLYCMMVLEAAQIESDAGVKVPEVREALRAFLATWVAPAL